MLKRVDRIYGWLLVLASCGHTAGTLLWTEPMSGIFIWSLGSALAGALLGTLNVIRAGRPDDKTLASVTMVGTACWALVALGFGISIHNVSDPRPLGHVIVSTALVIFSGATLRRKRNEERFSLTGIPVEANRRLSIWHLWARPLNCTASKEDSWRPT